MIDGKNLTPHQRKAALDKLNIPSEEKLDDYIKKNLTDEQTKIINKLLTDKEAAGKLLATPQAQKILEKLLGKG